MFLTLTIIKFKIYLFHVEHFLKGGIYLKTPLADRLRPNNIEDVVGQKHLLAEGRILKKIIDSKDIPNLIFYGPSGVGKTTVANIIAKKTGKKLYKLNATTASTSDLKDIIARRGGIEEQNGILLYLDEIQYFNKKQQQILLEFIETGDITLIASTTENPYFYVYNAILSRSNVFEFKLLEKEDIVLFLKKAISFLEKEKQISINYNIKAIEKLAVRSAGDLRRALNTLDLAVTAAADKETADLSDDIIEELTKNSGARYDRDGDAHFDIISAYQKSMRGSDPDASLHYLARLLEAGDLPSATRRLMVCAAEDVGLAYPQILPIVKACVDMALMLGLPEARIPLADAVLLVALAPKSNSGEKAIDKALQDVRMGKSGAIPRELQNKHFDGEDAFIKGQNYVYPHEYKNHYYPFDYLPKTLKGSKYFEFSDNKTEQAFYEYYKKIRGIK